MKKIKEKNLKSSEIIRFKLSIAALILVIRFCGLLHCFWRAKNSLKAILALSDGATMLWT
jgi:hypothetical protein